MEPRRFCNTEQTQFRHTIVQIYDLRWAYTYLGGWEIAANHIPKCAILWSQKLRS